MKKNNTNSQPEVTQQQQQQPYGYGYPQGYPYGYAQQPYAYGYPQGYGYPQQPVKNEPLYVMKKSAWTIIRFKYFLPMLLAGIITLIAHLFMKEILPDVVFYGLYALTALCVIIPMSIMIIRIANIKDDQILIYPNKVVKKWGILQKHEDTNIFTQILSVTAHQTFWGRLFNYGTLKVDVMGKWDFDMRGIKDPFKARDFLERFAANGMSMQQFIMN